MALLIAQRSQQNFAARRSTVNTDSIPWRTSSFSGGVTCVELGRTPDGGIAMRNSKDCGGPQVDYTADEMRAFFRGVKAGEFDDLV
jgi:uncharacterized protein DUF397